MSTASIATSNYKAFRASVLGQVKKEKEGEYYWRERGGENAHPCRVLREQIHLARKWVRQHVQSLLLQNPESEAYVRKILGIPQNIPLTAERWSTIRHCGQWFVPLLFTWPYVRRVMRSVSTYEGRYYLFEHLYKRVLACHLDLYTPAVDLALRSLDIPSYQQAANLCRLDPGWVKATYTLGLRKLAQIEAYAHYSHRKLDGLFADLLVQMGVVQCEAELKWLDYREAQDYGRSERDAGIVPKCRKMVEHMLSYGIERHAIAKVFQYSPSSFAPQRLQANLESLRVAQVMETTEVFEAIGEWLWRALPENFDYVLNVVGAKCAGDILRFNALLKAYEAPSAAIAQQLISLGASLDGLAQCQQLLLSAERDGKAAPVNEVALLATVPHSLAIEEIARSTEYLGRTEKLRDYLVVLIKHGYGGAASVLAFQVCYANTTVADLDAWLSIVGARGAGVPVEELAEWVRQSSKHGRIDSFRYLLQSVALPDFKHLQQAEPIVRFGRYFLDFLVQRKGLGSIQQLRDWYFDARGVQEIEYWSTVDPVTLSLLDDAYDRNNFAVVSGNESSLYSAVRERVTGVLGPRPYPADEATRAQYDQRYEAIRQTERAALLPILPALLEQTSGVLLLSVLRCAWQPPEVLQAQLDALSPAVAGLLSGQGPSSDGLSELEADAIAMVYQTSPDVVRGSWARVKGYESHLVGLSLSNLYQMRWNRSIRRLCSPLERRSLLALKQAKSVEAKFSPYASESVFDACKYLRSKRLDDAARDPWSLAAHLGVLFAAGRGDSVLDQWLVHELEGVSQMVQEGADVVLRLDQLDQILSTTLPDALKVRAKGFVRGFSEKDAYFLAERLVGRKNLLSEGNGHAQLAAALVRTEEVVVSTCQRWMHRERCKFVKEKTGSNTTALTAVLSKHPAVYFAKHAALLCTRNNVEMWQEARYAHLVVFDSQQRRLAGMAMIYIQRVDALDRSRNCLIIRAINPMADMLATHSASSIVDAFFDVAIEIAKTNDLAAVVFPYHNGAHLLSNQRDIEKDLEKRFIKPSLAYPASTYDDSSVTNGADWRTRPRVVEDRFYAYAHGDEAVSRLYAIWAAELPAAQSRYSYSSLVD